VTRGTGSRRSGCDHEVGVEGFGLGERCCLHDCFTTKGCSCWSWERASVQARQLGYDVAILDWSVQDYILRSVLVL
jgi:hypothetical protein